MRSFKDLNVAYKPEDGKKRFPGVVVSIRELVNLPIVVKDFETGIKDRAGRRPLYRGYRDERRAEEVLHQQRGDEEHPLASERDARRLSF